MAVDRLGIGRTRMVNAEGQPSLPWLSEPLGFGREQAMVHHALLVQGASGLGQFDFAVALAQAFLCESEPDDAARPCGACASCRLVQARSHPDLSVVLPEILQPALGWGEGTEGATDGDGKTRKPSKEIKVDAIRRVIAFAQLSSARGRAKVVVLFPADRINPVAANALLKTLEEPPGIARFVLATSAPQALPATLRSRCQAVAMPRPTVAQAEAWLASRGVVEPAVLLAAAGGGPLDALEWHAAGIDAAAWARLPLQVLAADASGLAAWPVPRAIEALMKLAHDALRLRHGAAPSFFASLPPSLAAAAGDAAVLAWIRALTDAARHAEHPLNAGLLIESLVLQGRQALGDNSAGPPRGARLSVH